MTQLIVSLFVCTILDLLMVFALKIEKDLGIAFQIRLLISPGGSAKK